LKTVIPFPAGFRSYCEAAKSKGLKFKVVEAKRIGPSFPSGMEYSESQHRLMKCFALINQRFPMPRHSFRKYFFFLQKFPRQLYI